MKFFASLAVILSLAAVVLGASYGGGAAPAAGGYGGSSGGGYGATSIPAPPCPKNYLFSCQPNLSPAPCSPASGGYGGSAGSYSHNYPVYQYADSFQTY